MVFIVVLACYISPDNLAETINFVMLTKISLKQEVLIFLNSVVVNFAKCNSSQGCTVKQELFL